MERNNKISGRAFIIWMIQNFAIVFFLDRMMNSDSFEDYFQGKEWIFIVTMLFSIGHLVLPLLSNLQKKPLSIIIWVTFTFCYVTAFISASCYFELDTLIIPAIQMSFMFMSAAFVIIFKFLKKLGFWSLFVTLSWIQLVIMIFLLVFITDKWYITLGSLFFLCFSMYFIWLIVFDVRKNKKDPPSPVEQDEFAWSVLVYSIILFTIVAITVMFVIYWIKECVNDVGRY